MRALRNADQQAGPGEHTPAPLPALAGLLQCGRSHATGAPARAAAATAEAVAQPAPACSGATDAASPVHDDVATLSDDANSAAVDTAARREPFRKYCSGRDALLSHVWHSGLLAQISEKWREPGIDGGATRMQQLTDELQVSVNSLMPRLAELANAQHTIYNCTDEQRRAEFDRHQRLAQASIIANVGAEGTGCSTTAGVDEALDEDAVLPAWNVQREAMRCLMALRCWQRAGEASAPGESAFLGVFLCARRCQYTFAV